MVPVKVDGLPLALAQVFRRSCSSCGSEGLHWHSGREFAGTARGRTLLSDIVANAGGLLSMRAVLNGQVWICRGCGEVGVFT